MLFMGTEKYPDENAFDTFIKKNGGYANAHTDSEQVNVFLDLYSVIQ
jgi:secreted Zn-dependent insulinase-like peptidase